MFLRLLLLGILVYAGARVVLWVRRYLKSLPHRSEVRISRGPGGVNEMVRDPVCGVYITEKESITAVVKGREYYFCSAECRRKFLEDQG
ncbi:MAG: YHS domain-containing protein [Desulfomonilaceae bacterium]|nr:YHS domain-containing protein [Desulfomonilaceae bacterium]